jgi:hypothetical protein
MTKLDELIEKFPESEFLIADGFDDAILGIEWSSERVVYSVAKCLDILIERDGMSYSEAIEYFDFNVSSAYVGEKTPIFINFLS